MVKLDKMADTIETVGMKFLPGSILVSTSYCEDRSSSQNADPNLTPFHNILLLLCSVLFPAQRDTKTIFLHSLMM